ncbi:hypothetical protein EGW08_006463, partial [Elysia chlorotica]
EESCSSYNTSETCQASCGLGTASGSCGWSFFHVRISSNHSPCSPDVNSCPDGHCDERESLHPSICPQDCATAKQDAIPPKSPHTHIGASTEQPRDFLGCGHVCRVTLAAAGAGVTLL